LTLELTLESSRLDTAPSLGSIQ
ncbi:mCG146504, partial [Mus musculus]